jgi:hypothetical protein
MFGSKPKNNSSIEINISHSGLDNLNESRISQIDKDIDSIKLNRSTLKSIKKVYKKEIKKMEREMNKIEEVKSIELEKINSIKIKELEKLKEKIKIQDKGKDKNASSIQKIQMELETLKVNLIDKENNYKNIIKNLMSDLKSLPDNVSVSASTDGVDLNDSILKGINEIMDEDEKKNLKNINGCTPVNMNSRNQSTNMTRSKIETNLKTSIIGRSDVDLYEDDSMLMELKEFKDDDIINYKFEVPLKYQISKGIKIINEEQKEGKFIRYYENKVIEIVTKSKNITRVRYLYDFF